MQALPGSLLPSFIRTLLAYLALVLLLALLVLPLLAVGILKRLLGAVVGGLVASIGSLMVLCVWMTALGAYLAWLLIWGDWVRLVQMLASIVECIRTVANF
jgi:hypothetical protein